VLSAVKRYWRTNGLRNGLALWATTHNHWTWRLIRRTPGVRSAVDRLIVNQLVYKMKPRPGPLSTMAGYTTWVSLTDRTFSARHLPPDPDLQAKLPPVDDVLKLFERRPDAALSDKSTLLFPHFAQWFTDGFLRTDPTDHRKNTSTHDIDLSQLYGQTEAVARILRSGVGGRLKSQLIDGREYPPYYFDENLEVKPEFAALALTVPGQDVKAEGVEALPADQLRTFFALGIPRGNIHYGFSMISTLFLREHNRIADALAAEHAGDADWLDERIFQTARDTMIVLLLKIVVQDYINHITPFDFKLFVEPGMGEDQKWYRQNWMSLEFNLLYRWHALVPTDVTVGGKEWPMSDMLWNNEVVTSRPLHELFTEAAAQPASHVSILNTAPFLMDIERKSIELARDNELASYNAYRKASSYPCLTSIDDLSSDPAVRDALAACYGSIDDVEFYVGLFAEDHPRGSALPTLMGTMVAVDAFSQALTNPLLASAIFGTQTFSKAGMEAIDATNRLADIVTRCGDGVPAGGVTFTRVGWTP
jgi:prostaglandin-endoperoxide synthase 2